MTTHVRVAIDELPITSELYDVNDYIGTQILGLTSLPLFEVGQESEIQGLGCESWSMSADGLQLRMRVHPHLKWSDGLPVTAEDYAFTLTSAIQNPKSPVRGLLRETKNYFPVISGRESKNALGIIASQHELMITLDRPNYLLPKILSHPAFGARREEGHSCSAGAYQLTTIGGHSIELRRNPHFNMPKVEPNGPLVDTIEFVLIRDRYDAIRAYEKGDVHLTCDTQFPYEELDSYSRRVDFHSKLIPVVVFLKSEHVSSRTIEHRIDPKALKSSEGLLGLNPIASFCLQANELTSASYASTVRASSHVSIAYDPYYPNFKIVSAIAKQMNTRGSEVDPITDNYFKPVARPDSRLVLSSLPFKDPYPIFLAAAYSQNLRRNPETFRDYLHLLARYLGTSSIKSRFDLANRLSQTLSESGAFIPLFQLQGLTLKHPRLKHREFAPGNLWSFDPTLNNGESPYAQT